MSIETLVGDTQIPPDIARNDYGYCFKLHGEHTHFLARGKPEERPSQLETTYSDGELLRYRLDGTTIRPLRGMRVDVSIGVPGDNVILQYRHAASMSPMPIQERDGRLYNANGMVHG